MGYNWDDQTRILELIKSLNMGGQDGIKQAVDGAFTQYDYFRQKVKEANSKR